MARVDPHNRTRYWADRQVRGLSLLHADFTRHDYAPHSHDALVIAATELGGAEFRSRGQVGEARTRSLMVFNPAEPHAGRMGRSRRWRYRALYFDALALGDLRQMLDLRAVPYFTDNLVADPELVRSFLALHRALEAGDEPQGAREALVSSLGELFRRHATGNGRALTGPRDGVLLARVQAEMRARLGEALGLDELGRVAGLTPFQLIALFKRGTGLTPHAYLTQLRLARAMEQLDAGRPIAEAALNAGFYDQSALHRHFRRVHGFTPMQYRRARAA